MSHGQMSSYFYSDIQKVEPRVVQSDGSGITMMSMFSCHALVPFSHHTPCLSNVTSHVHPFMSTVYPSAGYQDNAPCPEV